MQYLGKRRSPQPFGAQSDEWWTDDALVFNGNLSLRNVAGFDVQLTARNLLDEEYFHTSNTSVSRYRQPQRTLTLQVSRSF